MDFEQYIKTVINHTSESEGLEYEISEGALCRSAYLPRGVISMGECMDNAVKVPDYYVSRFFENSVEYFCIANVNSIFSTAFRYNYDVTDIILGENIIYISPEAFSGCIALTHITIPKGVRIIHKDTFKNCYNLRDVYYGGTEEEWEELNIYTGEHRVQNNGKPGLHCDVVWDKDDGNDPLLNAHIHFNCKVPKRPFMVFRESSSH